MKGRNFLRGKRRSEGNQENSHYVTRQVGAGFLVID